VWSPGGPVTVAAGESLLGGTGTVVEYVCIAVKGAVKVTLVASVGGNIFNAIHILSITHQRSKAIYLLHVGVIALGWMMNVGTSELTGVPPELRVIVTP
jgi:hypothetical protein